MSRGGVQSIETGAGILIALAELGGIASLTRLAAAVNEPPAKAHRYLKSLIEGGFVGQTADGKYKLGRQALLIGLAALNAEPPLMVAAQALAPLRDATGLTAFAAVYGNRGPTVVQIEPSRGAVIVNVRLGSVLPLLSSATGRVFAAFAAGADLAAQLEAERAAARLSASQLEKMLREVRARGCALIRDTVLPGVSAVSAPVFDHRGQVEVALTLLGPSGGVSDRLEDELTMAVLAAAKEASQRLAHKSS